MALEMDNVSKQLMDGPTTINDNKQLFDERGGWKAQCLLTWRRWTRAAKVSYLATCWDTDSSQPSPVLHWSERSPGEQLSSSVAPKVLLALDFPRPMEQDSWPQLDETSGLGSTEPPGKKQFKGYSKKTPNLWSEPERYTQIFLYRRSNRWRQY